MELYAVPDRQPAGPDAPAATAGVGDQPDEATAQLGTGVRLHDGRSPHPVLGPGAMRASPTPPSDHGSSQATPTRPGGGAGNDIDVWRFVQATDIIGSADVPEGLRVDAGAHLAGDDLFAVADGGAATSEASIDLRPGGEDGGAQVAAKMPCTAAFMALCFKPPHSRRSAHTIDLRLHMATVH